MAPGTEGSSGVFRQPSQTAPKDGTSLEDRDGNKAPLRKESGNVTPFFPSPIYPTSVHPVISSLNSHQGLWEMGIFGDAAPSPCPLAASSQDPQFWGKNLSACRALSAIGRRVCFISSCTE